MSHFRKTFLTGVQQKLMFQKLKNVYFVKKPFPPEWIAAHSLLLLKKVGWLILPAMKRILLSFL